MTAVAIADRVDLRLEGRTALVTGAGRGIGRATALAFAQLGADVALAARSSGEIEAVASEIEALGRRALPVACDVTEQDQVEHLVDRVGSELGGLQIVVNNAGGAQWIRAVENVDPERFDHAIALNLTAVQNVMRACAPLLFERPSESSVTNVVSIAARRGIEKMSYYSAAKAAVVGLSRAAAREWGPRGVRVNCLGPGWIETQLSSGLRNDGEFFESSIEQIPLRRWGRPDDIASAIAFLASDAAAYVNGATLYVDGGLLA